MSRRTRISKPEPGPRDPVLTAFAVSPPGFDDLVEAELRDLGVPGVARVVGGVEFSGGWTDIYRANLHSRIASRILVRVARFRAATFGELEVGLSRVEWGPWLPPSPPIECKVASHRSRLYHTGKVAEVAMAALAQAAGAQPAASGEAGIRLHLRLDGPEATVSLDTSGDHLHRRGYRTEAGPAPLRENLAAGLLRRASWDGAEPLLDPLCGSGTFAIEAAWMALRIPPGWLRTFAFERLPSFRQGAWKALRDQAGARILKSLPSPVFASDRDPGALRFALQACRRAGLADRIQVAQCDVAELEPPAASGLVITNPPYGRRIAGAGDACAALGRALRGPFSAWRWAVVLGDRGLEARLGLTPGARFPFQSGGLRLWLATAGAPEG